MFNPFSFSEWKSYLKSDQFKKEWDRLCLRIPDPERPIKIILIVLGVTWSFLSVWGAFLGYKRAYYRFMRAKDEYPRLNPNPAIVYVSMAVGAVIVPMIVLVCFGMLKALIGPMMIQMAHERPYQLAWLAMNLLLAGGLYFSHMRWARGVSDYLSEKMRFGSAKFAQEDELAEYKTTKGFYIGGSYIYSKQGHLLTVAGTRGGKGVNIILPNLLGLGGFEGSWVVIDPKGENAAISARIQREKGRKVVILNPWDLLGLASEFYNPLDLLDATNPNVIDDVQLIAETIVPTTSKGDTDHFNARARTIIAGLLLHLVTEDKHQHERNLATLWEWLRLDTTQWHNLLADMKTNTSKNGGEVCEKTAEEILSLMLNGSREYASVMSTAQKWTDYLKSPALRKSMASSSFSAEELTSGNVTLYVIIPADRLKTHYQWLRLVVSALMRSVIRKPDKRVCFLLDEFYALGYLSEIDIALGAYAGYGVSVWAILQNLVQLRDMYEGNWENFISSCAVRHFFNMNDNTTLDYVSRLFGQKSVPTYTTTPTGSMLSGATARPLITPDELRRASADMIFTLIDQKPVTFFPKVPYYQVLEEGRDFDRNPYHNS
jgi:type IV secretion system protein VirD4